jgi:hypothetical protein
MRQKGNSKESDKFDVHVAINQSGNSFPRGVPAARKVSAQRSSCKLSFIRYTTDNIRDSTLVYSDPKAERWPGTENTGNIPRFSSSK